MKKRFFRYGWIRGLTDVIRTLSLSASLFSSGLVSDEFSLYGVKESQEQL